MASLLATGLGAAPLPGGTLDPTSVSKYVAPLSIPPAMPKALGSASLPFDYYKIAARQIQQQVLPLGSPQTTVWAYGSVDHPNTFHYPANTIEAQVNRAVRVTWSNELKDAAGHYLPHLLPVDPSLHWANPGKLACMHPSATGTDCEPDPANLPTDDVTGAALPYRGPVPLVTHLHGGHTMDKSDGYPEAWTLPNANDIPTGYAARGSHWGQVTAPGVSNQVGAATYQYANDQRATNLWYHDHTLGITRNNIYAGLSGEYFLRDGFTDLPSVLLPGPAPKRGDPVSTKYYEIPLVIQDRSFNADGSLFYSGDRAFFESLEQSQLQIPFTPKPTLSGAASDVAPIWNPEFFGNTMVVNGNTWPSLNVEKRRYRFRVLNGSNTRFLILKLTTRDPSTTPDPADPVANPTWTPAPVALPFWQVGADGGFLPRPVRRDMLLLAPAERADVVVDFSLSALNQPIYLVNEGPDEPYGGGAPGDGSFVSSNNLTTGHVMKLQVVPRTSQDRSVPPQLISALLPAPNLGTPGTIRRVSINEMDSGNVNVVTDTFGNVVESNDPLASPFGPTISMLGTSTASATGIVPNPIPWMDPITENPANGVTELWEVYNYTADAHPIHIHLVEFQIVNREALTTDGDGLTTNPANPFNPRQVSAPETWEGGPKDMVIAYPGQVTRVKARFDKTGLYVWHCHIAEHEDHDMMRPMCVGTQADCPVALATP